MRIEDISEYRRGSFPQPYTDSSFYGGNESMPFVQVADLNDNTFYLNTQTQKTISKKAQPYSVFVNKGTVVITLQGTIGRVAITQYDSYIDRTLAIFEKIDKNLNKKYFAYQLKNIFNLKKQYARGSTIKTITKEEFSDFKIPIPPLEVQEEIVNILDKFEEYINSIESGLKGEIEARHQQYEYYRDKLLTFDRKEV